mmetsp:Transcript_61005/g.70872  ORF Transcript_61005/g.70872 Transcript_61005/m.70872 type:complete len:269 (+) Transcript_61005:377-1183(+)
MCLAVGIKLRGVHPDARCKKACRHQIRVGVACRTAILKVSASLCNDLIGNSDGSSTCSDSKGELVVSRRLVVPCKTRVVVLAVYDNVFANRRREVLDASVNGLDTVGCTSCCSGVVRVHATAVPVTTDRLGCVVYIQLVVFLKLKNAEVQPASHDHVVSHFNPLAGTNLELPLTRHHFSIDTGHLDAHPKSEFVVALSVLAAKGGLRSEPAVVGALRTRVPVGGPSQGPVILREHVLLLHAKPRLVVGSVSLKDGASNIACIVCSGFT